jgi:hypothetical protein
MQNQYPCVYLLAVHLENEQPLHFTDTTNMVDTLNNSKSSTLTEWFETNKLCSEGTHLKYPDFCDMFVWNKSKKNGQKDKKILLLVA